MRFNRGAIFAIALCVALGAAYVFWPARAQGQTVYVDSFRVGVDSGPQHVRGLTVVGFSCASVGSAYQCFTLSR